MENQLSSNCTMTMSSLVGDEELTNSDGEFVCVDLQGFKTCGNNFIVKEICVYHEDFIFHGNVKSPYKFNQLPSFYKRQASWLTAFYHGITFNSGSITLNEAIQQTIGYVRGKKIFVKGAEKVEWLNGIYGKFCEIDCENLEDYTSIQMNSMKMNEIYPHCVYHTKLTTDADCHCAFINARNLYDVCSKNNLLLNENIQERNWRSDCQEVIRE